MEKDNLNKTINEIFKEQYIVPLYQRNFAWGKDEIERLLQDVYENFKTSPDSNYYIGSLIVLRRADNVFEVIDGQQRLTVLSLLTKMLGINNEPKLSYDSRPEVELFFSALYNGQDINSLKDHSKVFHLINAVSAINQSNLCDMAEKDKILTIDNLPEEEKNNFISYFKDNVILVRVEIPGDTDVASYFEIMNNRGEQLQKHEIVKSLLISRIKNREKEKLFAKIWDACSQMDIPIQKLFKNDLRIKLFGQAYNDYTDYLTKEESCLSDGDVKAPALEDILNPDFKAYKLFKDDDANDEIENENGLGQKAIIDFPNFLMHVLKLEYNEKYNKTRNDNKGIPLNEKYLLQVYSEIKEDVDPMKFIDFLLYYRTIFDRYIVRSADDSNQEDHFKWILVKPKQYDKSIKYDNNTFDDKSQDYLIKALSMLQVRFRNRIYKEWLNDSLGWIAEKYGSNINNVNSKEYLSFLHDLMINYYDSNFGEVIDDNWEFQNIGQNTPHFIFFFIDYLYWVAWKKKITGIANLDMIDDFDFKYWNSVEHHLPQSFEGKSFDKKLIDKLGNLCLVSKNANSRMSNESPIGKATKNGKYYKKGLSPKRKIMYDITNKETNWEKEQIEQHYNNVKMLLTQRETLLKN